MDEPHATHVSCQLIHHVETAPTQRLRCLTGILLTQIEQLKIIGRSRGEVWVLQIHAPDPEPLFLEPFDEVTRDEATRSTD